jgi:hypothetical protein
LNVQPGTVLANELKLNACKLAKWTVQSLLVGSDLIKFGTTRRDRRIRVPEFGANQTTGINELLLLQGCHLAFFKNSSTKIPKLKPFFFLKNQAFFNKSSSKFCLSFAKINFSGNLNSITLSFDLNYYRA